MHLKTISVGDARREKWDVIVVGSSFAAHFFVYGLPKNRRVLFVEKGQYISHDDQIKRGAPTLPEEPVNLKNTSPHPKEWIAHTLFGGNSNCWFGQTPRSHPNDFRVKTLYGVGQDWPISYEELEPYYSEVETFMEISGGGNEHILPRSAPFPYPPHAPSRSDVLLRSHRPDVWFAAPTARASGGQRSPCCTNGVCMLCPIDAKFTILNGGQGFTNENHRLVLGAEVRFVRIENKTARSVVVRTGAGEEIEIFGDVIGLGANALFNPAILLRSGYSHGALGKYLHEQSSVNLILDVPIGNYFGGTSITGHGYAFYDGPHRKERASVLIENWNAIAEIRPEKGKWINRLHLVAIAEDIPQEVNRVEIDDKGDVVVHWSGHSEYSYAGLDYAFEHLGGTLPFPIEKIVHKELRGTEAHIQGTHRMGDDPATSVVDRNLRLHDVPNLLLLGAGCFPATSAANPTLTLSALSLKAGRALQ